LSKIPSVSSGKGDSGGCSGFKNVEFNGEYPIATINYSEKGCPVKVSSEVFSLIPRPWL